jgi:hypothetical protein
VHNDFRRTERVGNALFDLVGDIVRVGDTGGSGDADGDFSEDDPGGPARERTFRTCSIRGIRSTRRRTSAESSPRPSTRIGTVSFRIWYPLGR